MLGFAKDDNHTCPCECGYSAPSCIETQYRCTTVGLLKQLGRWLSFAFLIEFELTRYILTLIF